MAKRGRSKKSSNWLTVIMLAVVLIAAVAAGIYYASSRAVQKKMLRAALPERRSKLSCWRNPRRHRKQWTIFC